MATEIVKMSSKGQLVVPQNIRENEDFKTGDRFIPFAVNEGVLFKRINLPDAKAEFEKLAKEINSQFKKQKIRPENVNEAVKWARKK
ncbi:hypothetical protein AYK26_01475 [Euryarchaeota archaeon SM23-78]|nr:MAG: hypothetical protein AYK26_01475 [Euryarchaeota archaeon SM23-78]MBW3000463.1 hypothetical protein [Candidatus Woesearchaeota archaeon]